MALATIGTAAAFSITNVLAELGVKAFSDNGESEIKRHNEQIQVFHYLYYIPKSGD